MPKVGNKEYPYTPAGKAAAEKEAAKNRASRNRYNSSVKARAASKGVKQQNVPTTGLSSLGSVGGSPAPASTPPTNAQYTADLSAWKQNKKAMMGK